MMIEHRSRRRSDRGFTFVEMLITVTLIALVAAVVSAAVIVILRSQDGVVASTAESHDTRQVVSYLPLDIESGPSRADAYRAATGGDPGDRSSEVLTCPSRRRHRATPRAAARPRTP